MIIRRAIALGALSVACVAAACVIGPKQDDPLEDRALDDAGTVMDVGLGTGGDVEAPAVDAVAAPPETGGSADTSVPSSDAAADADAGDATDATDASDASDASDAAEGG